MSKELLQVGDIVSFDPNVHFGTDSPHKSFAFALIVQIDEFPRTNQTTDHIKCYLASMFLPHLGRDHAWLFAEEIIKET